MRVPSRFGPPRAAVVLAVLVSLPGWPGGPGTAVARAQAPTTPSVIVVPATPVAGAAGVTQPRRPMSGIRLPPGVSLPGEVRLGLSEGPPGPEGAPPGGTNAAPDPAEARVQPLLQVRVDRRPEMLVQAAARALGVPGGEASGTGAGPGTNEVDRLQADLQSGNWRGISTLLQSLNTNHAAQVYDHVLQQFLSMPGQGGGPGRPGMPGGMVMGPMPGQPMMPGVPPPANFVTPDDVLGLANVCPGELNENRLQQLGQLLARALQGVPSTAPLVAGLEKGVGRLGGSDPATRDLVARLFVAAGRLEEAGRFVRPFDPNATPPDFALWDLHATLLSAEGRDTSRSPGPEGAEARRQTLRRAWDLNEKLLLNPQVPARERESALSRTLDLLPVLGRDGGSNWLRAHFLDRPEVGAAVVAHVASGVARGTAERMAANRLRFLRQQKQVGETLIGSGADLAGWKPLLLVMASGWAREAEFTRSRPVMNPGMMPQFDAFGNQVYFPQPQRFQDPNQPEPVGAAELLEVVPNEAWVDSLDRLTASRIAAGRFQMRLRAGQYEEAVEELGRLARDDVRVGRTMAQDLLNGWAEARQPNRPNPYGNRVYYGPYGMNQGGEGIPLTRARQERNLDELAGLLAKFKALQLEGLDDGVVVSAFTRAHSAAEVFRIEDLERVFGPLPSLRPEMLAELLQSMRSRLAGQWRQPRVQQDGKTRRNDREIAAEVRRGYELVARLAEEGIGRKADDWRLVAARAAVLYDWAEFDYGQKVDLAVYTARRDEAFAAFERASVLYAAAVPGMPEEEQGPQVHQQWFNATLGASDLAYLTRQTEPSTNQLARIRRAFLALPGDAAERHLAAFGRQLADASGGLKPELKPRYARAGLDVVGEHPAAREARDLVRHYDDLLREIRLEARIDGDASVGHRQPFGVFIAIVHTEAVGRESGGFARYLQNQGNLGYYYNPYGAGPVNYRDEFEKQVREKFSDAFEILTVTFHDEKTEARGTPRTGWREFPYAYLLLRAKDAGVDKLPSLQISMDFSDARGQVSLPVVSTPVLLDARSENPPPRPVRQLELVQVLDDRELAGGGRTATLELKATARGLVPDLDRLVDVAVPGFRVTKTDDRGLTLSQMDVEGDDVAPVSERVWILTLEPDTSGAAAAVLRFPRPLPAEVRTTYKRYADADLVEVPAEVAVAGLALRPDRTWWWVVGGVALGLLAVGTLLRRRPPAPAAVVAPRYVVPSEVTPFSVLHVLQRLAGDPEVSLTPAQREELSGTVTELQRRFFAREPRAGSDGPDLRALAERWVAQAGR